MSNRKFCPVHRCYNINECPWCTMVPVQVVPPKPVLTEDDKDLLLRMGIDPER